MTVICYGGMVNVAQVAAEAASNARISAEVLERRSLGLLDIDALGESVRKTRRVVIGDEAQQRLGFGAEITAQISERFNTSLHAPIVRVTGWNVPYPPFTSLEHHYRPDARRVALGKLTEY